MSKIKIFTTIVLVAVIGAGVFYACKKDDTISDSSLTQNSKANKSFDEALFHSILNHPDVDFDFANYVEGTDVANSYIVIDGNCTYGVFITNAASELDAWLTAEATIEKEIGSFVIQGLLVGISKKCKNVIVHDIDITAITEQMYFKEYEVACADFISSICDLTQVEIDKLNTLAVLMQNAADANDMDSFEEYYDELLHIYHKCDDPVSGKEKFEKNSMATVLFMDNMTAKYPQFGLLAEDRQFEVLTAVFSYMDFPIPSGLPYTGDKTKCKDECQYDYKLATNVNITTYAVAMLGCTFTVAGAGFCIIIATATFAASQSTTKFLYDRCLDRC
jgi:hypothetical protein